MFRADENNFLRDADGNLAAPLVSSFTIAEMIYPGASVICCRLWDGSVPQTLEVSAEDAHQFRLTSAAARRLANSLLAAADDLDGVDHPQQ